MARGGRRLPALLVAAAAASLAPRRPRAWASPAARGHVSRAFRRRHTLPLGASVSPPRPPVQRRAEGGELAAPALRGRAAVAEELLALLRAAAPMSLVQLGLVMLGTVDTLMVGRVSAEAIGGVALGNYWKFLWVVLGQGSLMALDGLVSKAAGAGDKDGVGAGLFSGLALALIYSALLSPLLLLCGRALELLGQPSSLVPFASRYAAVQTLAVLPSLLFVVLRQTLQAVGALRPILLSVLLANVLNVFLNAGLIWGIPALGVPALGPMGSSWATAWCSWALLLALALLGRGALSPYLVGTAARRALGAQPLARFARLGLPIGLHQVTEFMAFAVMLGLVGRLGVVAVAAHQIAMSIAGFTWNVSLGISSAAAVRTGYALGRGDADGVRRAGVISIAFSAALMAAAGAVMALFPTALASCWSSDAQVVAQAALLLPVAGAFQVFDGTQTVASGVLRGLLDTRGLALAFLGYWSIGTPLSVVLSRSYGVPGIWWGMVVGLLATSVLLQLRVARSMLQVEGACRQDSSPAVSADTEMAA